MTVVELAMFPELPGRLFTPADAGRLRAVAAVEMAAPLTGFRSPEARERLGRARILLTGWGSPLLDERALDDAPRLRAVVHAAGSVKGHVSPEVFARGIPVSSAAAANAVPVAEYTVAMILLAGKGAPALAREYRARREDLGLVRRSLDIGNHGRTVGLVGASRTGRRVLELLRPFDLRVLLADPFVDPPTARSLGARLVDLDEIFTASDIVSLHAPATAHTRGMVSRRRLAAMRDGATLINTARGSLVDQDALVAELVGGRLSAVLDVTEPEVTAAESPLWELPNVVLTPHIAGALGNEMTRLGSSAVEEVLRVVAGEPLLHRVDPATLFMTA
ncbi:hydroxyacid dehydrogenase [Streptosporangium roseum]|uniref:D-isomer specific 2-hydroxyacid dehydrogenase NAD-binding protein n=1 Tax=Streptosporangium roseum (strain ATCC 12428 / DSM 43021 / JCM 3005 / KCTC 9067 / NCIMB 10171 / NRRL 2505 / NI 9100) TaxID=479432 RepID=D2AQS3_STRRD|nr:hydroxyacid dehydrogenase [Streptosporangium roseum]ACZ86470.1 D-isomer specific 2-hydroxyacid dehydrogenase NAD-binding protein [Streptosporangium roseum DSM 43021]